MAQTNPCARTLWGYLPIGETELLNVKTTWPAVRVVPEGGKRDAVLHSTGYALPDGSLPQNPVLSVIASCSNGSHSIELIHIRAQEGDRDENIYLVSWMGDSVTSRTLIAALQTTCEFTFLRTCQVDSVGGLFIQQLQHSFDCDNEEFVGTEKLPSFTVVLNTNNVIKEIINLAD